MIIVTLGAFTVQKKKKQEKNLKRISQEEIKMIAATPCERGVNFTHVLTICDKFKILSKVVNEEKSYKLIANSNSIQKVIKNWSGRVNKMSCSANPRLLFNILRPLSIAEPYFTQ